MDLFAVRDVIFRRQDNDTYLSSRGAQGLAVSVIFTALATCFVSARLYTRVRLMRRMESNDWMIVIALVCYNPTQLIGHGAWPALTLI